MNREEYAGRVQAMRERIKVTYTPLAGTVAKEPQGAKLLMEETDGTE